MPTASMTAPDKNCTKQHINSAACWPANTMRAKSQNFETSAVMPVWSLGLVVTLAESFCAERLLRELVISRAWVRSGCVTICFERTKTHNSGLLGAEYSCTSASWAASRPTSFRSRSIHDDQKKDSRTLLAICNASGIQPPTW